MDLRLEFGLCARHRREELGIGRGKVAARAGLSEEMIAKIENGDTGVSFDALPQLAEALETTIRDLFLYADPGEPDEDPDRRRTTLRGVRLLSQLRRDDLEYHVDQLAVTVKHRPRRPKPSKK